MKWCVPWKMSNGGENFVLQVLQFQWMVVCHELPGGASISQDTLNECFVEGQFKVCA
jgi:hypothetical protein